MATVLAPGDPPTVVFISGLGEPGANWSAVVSLLATEPATVTYDRPGIGDTPPRPAPNPPLPYSAFADELATLLDQLDQRGPLVLVGHSFGALIAHAFADRHAERLTGLVLVDASLPGMALWPGDDQQRRDGDDDGATVVDVHVGQAQILAARPPPVPAVVVCRTPGRWVIDLPADYPVDQRWQQHQARLAAQLDAPLIVAGDSGHQIPRQAPALVGYAVDSVVRAVRQTRPVRLDPATVVAAGGQLREPGP